MQLTSVDQVDLILFRKAVKTLNGSLLKIGQFPNTFILIFEEKAAEQDDEEDEVSLIVTNGFDKLYRIELSYSFMARHRNKVGIEGTWKAYFELLK